MPLSDLSSFMPDDDFAELLWENGQIVTNKPKRTFLPTPFPSHKETRHATDTKLPVFEPANSSLHDLSVPVPSSNIGSNAQDDWIHYSSDDPFGSEFFSELSGVNPNPLPNDRNAGIGVKDSRNVTNFSHFARPVAFANNSKTRSGKNVPASNNGIESARKSAVVSQETSRSNNQYNCVDKNNNALGINILDSDFQAEKRHEVVIASSVCSANSGGAGSNDPKIREKRKNPEGEESRYHSEDLEDDSVDVKTPSVARGGPSAKRTRAAEVHNLSERRRRDRINEKMRALQELIPNCNKVDKASMLDEAIEYLKTLQLQVQMMSMGTGLCMSPMMLPPGMQHMRAPQMAHFPHMGLGLGMGMGYGMGMLDMNSSPSCPLVPVPPMCPSQFPVRGVHAPPSHQLFGMPGFPVSGTMVHPVSVQDTDPAFRSKDQHTLNLESTPKASTSDR